MGLPRSKYVSDGQEGVYHCFSRCVRRAFLYGYDKLTGKDFSHRKQWIVDRLRQLTTIFAIEVCTYAIMENHYHVTLRTRPDIVAAWSDLEVAARWLNLFPPKPRGKKMTMPLLDEQIRALANWPDRIAVLRKRLCSLSWFMGRLNEFIARAANKEDRVKGRFWESRFKCQALLDEAAIAACMIYVDLNPIRAGLAATPEASDFTGIQERIRGWQKEPVDSSSISNATELDNDVIPEHSPSADWLCPVQSDINRRGILQMTEIEYFDLVDKSGRILQPNKGGSVDIDLEPILLRIGVIPKAWGETISRFGSGFYLAAGRLSNMRNFAKHLDHRWFKGLSTARAIFKS